MEAIKIKNGMTAGVWKAEEECLYRADGAHLGDMGGGAIEDEESVANVAAIVSAVNNTWGKGYDPGKMQELYKALNAICYNLDAGLTVTIKPNDERHKHYLELLQSATL